MLAGQVPGPGLHMRAGAGSCFQQASLKQVLMMYCPACSVILLWRRPHSLTLQGAPGVSGARRGSAVACQTLLAVACPKHWHDGSCVASAAAYCVAQVMAYLSAVSTKF